MVAQGVWTASARTFARARRRTGRNRCGELRDAKTGSGRARRADKSCQPRSEGYRDASKSVQPVEDEIAIVEAGLEELKPQPGSLPENEWT